MHQLFVSIIHIIGSTLFVCLIDDLHYFITQTYSVVIFSFFLLNSYETTKCGSWYIACLFNTGCATFLIKSKYDATHDTPYQVHLVSYLVVEEHVDTFALRDVFVSALANPSRYKATQFLSYGS